MLTRKILSLLAIGLIMCHSASAQGKLTRERINALLQSSYTQVNGKDSPELVPFSIRMQHFFSFYQRLETGWQNEFGSKLSPEDYAVLNEYAARHTEETKADEEKYQAAWMDIASRAERMSGMEIAAEINAAMERSLALQDARYQSVLSRLSVEGQKTVHAFAYENVRPSFLKEDPLTVARAEPEFYKAQILWHYELARTGKVPPKPPAELQPGTRAVTTQSAQQGQLGSTPSQ